MFMIAINYDLLLKQYESILTGRWITDLANTSAFLMEELPQLNWVGFYLLDGETLFLGPFQGQVACTEIKIGKGVCGSAAKANKTLRVEDVDQFKGHISCDSRSRSEIVVPISIAGRVVGVLDLDAPILSRFSSEDANFLESLITILCSRIQLPASC